jgi:hypothetical protein
MASYVKDFSIRPKKQTAKPFRLLGVLYKDALGASVIVFDSKDWYIDNAILIPSRYHNHHIDDCMIKQNNEVFDNVFRGNNLIVNPENPFGTPLDVLPTRNIKIIGKNDAKIVGCDINRRSYHSFLKEEQDMVGDFWGWRTHQISLSKCTCFEISGIEFFQTRGWTMSFDFCCDGYIHDLKIVSNVKNGDGVNIRAAAIIASG